MKMVVTLAVVALLTSCAVNVAPVATGRSRADGVVEFSFQYALMTKPVIDWPTVQSQAAQRCAAWGYQNAEAFGGDTQQCAMADPYGNCNTMKVTLTYQCTN